MSSSGSPAADIMMMNAAPKYLSTYFICYDIMCHFLSFSIMTSLTSSKKCRQFLRTLIDKASCRWGIVVATMIIGNHQNSREICVVSGQKLSDVLPRTLLNALRILLCALTTVFSFNADSLFVSHVSIVAEASTIGATRTHNWFQMHVCAGDLTSITFFFVMLV